MIFYTLKSNPNNRTQLAERAFIRRAWNKEHLQAIFTDHHKGADHFEVHPLQTELYPWLILPPTIRCDQIATAAYECTEGDAAKQLKVYVCRALGEHDYTHVYMISKVYGSWIQ